MRMQYGNLLNLLYSLVTFQTSQSLVQHRRVTVDLETYLHGSRDKILTSPIRFHYDWMSNPHQFLDGFWDNITASDAQIPVFIVLADLSAKQMGNRMGNFLQYVACGLLAGTHIVIVDFSRYYELHDHEDALPSTNSNKRYGAPFFDAIPVVIVHPHPASDQASARMMYRTKCGTGIPNPWEYSLPVVDMIPYYRQIILPAIEAQISALIDLYELSSTLILPSIEEFEEMQNIRKHRPQSQTEKFHKVVDTPDLNVVLDTTTRDNLPMYPHVTIHWRCSDNLFFDYMGLTPYHYILSRLPPWAIYVYIVTDTSYGDANNYPDPNRKSMYSGLCIPIINKLVKRIQIRLPLAQIVVRAGGRPDSLFITIAMLIYSNITFCSASTFCFHFASSKPYGKLYLPESDKLFYGVNPFNCCNNVIKTMTGALPISDWRLPNGTKIRAEDDSATNGADFISILSNRSYPFVSRTSSFPIMNDTNWFYPVAAPTALLPRQRRKRWIKHSSNSHIQSTVDQSRVEPDSSSKGSFIFTMTGGFFAMMLLILLQCTLWRSIPTATSHRSLYHQH